MIANLKKLFESTLGGVADGTLSRLEPVELATAALLVELARADFTSTDGEIAMARRLLAERFGLDAGAVQSLMDRAVRRADQAVSLHEFTHQLNRELEPKEKSAVIEMLWRLSLVDQRLDKHEEQLIRRIAGLLHVSDRELLRLREKIRAQGS